MLPPQTSSVSGAGAGPQLIQCPQSSSRRIPLRPKNLTSTIPAYPISKCSSISPSASAGWADDDNKENVPPPPPIVLSASSSPTPAPAKKVVHHHHHSASPVDNISIIDGSLADELSAIRERLYRVKVDREETDKLLGDRARMLDLQLKDILKRGEVQKQLEMELDRLYRLKEIKLASQRISPVRSLRDREQQKKMMY